jgi:hypothetical protein
MEFMELWHLELIGPVEDAPNKTLGLVILAETEEMARYLAMGQAGDETPQAWLDRSQTTCTPVDMTGPSRVILTAYGSEYRPTPPTKSVDLDAERKRWLDWLAGLESVDSPTVPYGKIFLTPSQCIENIKMRTSLGEGLLLSLMSDSEGDICRLTRWRIDCLDV